MTTIGVTGAAGYIGSRVVHVAREAGHNVVAVDDWSSSKMDGATAPIDTADVRNHGVQEWLAGQADVVVHLAAVPGVQACEEDPDHAYEVNLGATVGLARRCAEYDTSLVLVSTCAVYGPDPPQPITQDSPTDPRGTYATSKYLAEQAVRTLAPRQFPAAVMRLTNVFGQHVVDGQVVDKPTVVNLFAQRALEGKTIEVHAPGTQVRDFVHVRDVADALYKAALVVAQSDELEATTSVLGSGYERSIRVVATQAVQTLGGEVQVVPNPREPQVREHFEVDTGAVRAALGWRPELTPLSHYLEVAQ